MLHYSQEQLNQHYFQFKSNACIMFVDIQCVYIMHKALCRAVSKYVRLYSVCCGFDLVMYGLE